MLSLIIAFLSFSSFLWPQSSLSSTNILLELYSDSGWIQIDSLKNGQRVFRKKIGNSDIPATMVKQTTSVSVSALISTIEDVGNYLNFIHDPYLERSDLLKRAPHFIDSYQLFDLPLIANRHTIFRMVKNDGFEDGRVRLEWTSISRESEYSEYLDSMDTIHGNPIHLAANVGGWEIIPLPDGNVEVSYRLYVDPAGLVPDFLVARGNLVNSPKMVENVIEEAKRREGKND